MKHLFVPYELALQLKEKGFDELCFGLYPSLNKELIIKDFINQKYADEYFGGFAAPLYQQAISYLNKIGDEKHLNILISFTGCEWLEDIDMEIEEALKLI